MDEFQTAWIVFSSAGYDPLDPDQTQFLEDYETFKVKAYDFDRRLAAIFVQAFDECNNLESLFKLSSIMGGLAERPVIKREVEPKYRKIIDYFNEDLDTVKDIYDKAVATYDKTGFFEVDRCWAQVSGTLCWVMKMRGRVDYPIEPMKMMEYP